MTLNRLPKAFLVFSVIYSSQNHAAILPKCVTAVAQTEAKVRSDDFTADHDASDYRASFGASFMDRARKIRAEGGVWADLGARRALAQIEELDRGVSENTVFIAFSRFIDARIGFDLAQLEEKRKNNFKFLTGDLKDEKLLKEKSLDLATDFLGAFAYDSRPDLILANYLRALKDDGLLFLRFIPSENYVDVRGKKLKLSEWLETIPGISVTTIHNGAYQITISDRSAIRIPKLEVTEWLAHKSPPIRQFRELPQK